VLGAPAEDLDDALDLALAPDDGVEPALLGEGGEVAPEGVERGSLRGALALALAAGAGLALTGAAGHFAFFLVHARAEEVEDLFADFLEFEAEVHEDLGGDAVVLAQEAEQEVLGADIVMV